MFSTKKTTRVHFLESVTEQYCIFFPDETLHLSKGGGSLKLYRPSLVVSSHSKMRILYQRNTMLREKRFCISLKLECFSQQVSVFNAKVQTLKTTVVSNLSLTLKTRSI